MSSSGRVSNSSVSGNCAATAFLKEGTFMTCPLHCVSTEDMPSGLRWTCFNSHANGAKSDFDCHVVDETKRRQSDSSATWSMLELQANPLPHCNKNGRWWLWTGAVTAMVDRYWLIVMVACWVIDALEHSMHNRETRHSNKRYDIHWKRCVFARLSCINSPQWTCARAPNLVLIATSLIKPMGGKSDSAAMWSILELQAHPLPQCWENGQWWWWMAAVSVSWSFAKWLSGFFLEWLLVWSRPLKVYTNSDCQLKLYV